MEEYNWKRDDKQPRDVDVQPCVYCGEPTALFSPHAVRRHLEDGVLECYCKNAGYFYDRVFEQ